MQSTKKITLPIKVIIIGCIIGLVVAGIGGFKQFDSKRINNERKEVAQKQSQEAVDKANARLKEIEKEYYPLKEQYEKKEQEIDTMKHTAGSAFGSMGLFALGGFMGTVGFLLTGAGAIVMFIAHRREITAYTTQQVMPVAQEGIEKTTPTVADAAGSIAKSISKGIQEGKAESVDNK